MIKAVILAGGSGTRLWPVSRSAKPKQFLSLSNNKTMFQETVLRLENLDVESTITICNEDHRFFVAEQLKQIDKLDEILLEPFGKNTAPAVTLAALMSDSDSLLLILPSDHIISNQKKFEETVKKAVPLAKSGKLVTFGVVPTNPNTGFGYIKKGKEVVEGYEVENFSEKPNYETAKEFYQSGNYLWNSGIFLFQAKTFLKELKKYRPDILKLCEKSLTDLTGDLDFLRVNKDHFDKISPESLDYAVMEKTSESVVIPMDAGWNDAGSWNALWEINEKDVNMNALKGDIFVHDTNNSLIHSDDKLIVCIGIRDLVIVSTKDALLISKKDLRDDTKKVLEKLKDENRSELENSKEVFRPWGKYESVDQGNGYQVKRITVYPGGKLSLQKHRHRSEHWVVVHGRAKVTKNDETFELGENESVDIPVGAIHSLENPGEIDLQLIEIQSGPYLGEDDITRIEDIYGRKD